MAHDVDPEVFAAGFMFSGGQIRDAVQTARNLALKKKTNGNSISAHDVRTACLLQSNRKLATLARQIKPSYTWNDIVLPEDRFEQLKDIVNHARHKALVFDSWGFGRKLSYGKGLNVLFTGPSGTGKTMSAEIMAADLGLHLYKIDLARVVSKFIGETEKNLSKIFEEAETSNAILFFDEADALFGKRSEVHDAHDRYANIETSYLLQRMEEYEGIIILATNFRRNMDDAFVRRIQYAVEFPFPEKHDRREIWTKTWPHELPLSDDIDFDFLAGRFEMSGGNIKNICLNSAFIAAADGKTVTMNHLMKATRNEYRKMGKLMMGGEFLELKSVSG
jgi:SpoVK/Ycf46/Vps4 family AAA+-type ATPase